MTGNSIKKDFARNGKVYDTDFNYFDPSDECGITVIYTASEPEAEFRRDILAAGTAYTEQYI